MLHVWWRFHRLVMHVKLIYIVLSSLCFKRHLDNVIVLLSRRLCVTIVRKPCHSQIKAIPNMISVRQHCHCKTMSNEQRTNIKFLAKLGRTPTETFEMLKAAYGDQTLSRARVFEWHKRFSSGREDVDDDPRPGRPSTSRNSDNVEKVKELVQSDRRLTIRMIADQLTLDKETVRLILVNDLGMRKICAKMVPRLLTDDQKTRRMTVCQDVLEQLAVNGKLLESVITGEW